MNSFSLEPNAIMFSHNDLDGIGCGILFKSVLGIYAEVHYCGYHNVDEIIIERLNEIEESNERPQIVISDLGIKPETTERVDRYQGEKILLDHHKTNHWIAEKYDWAVIDEEASGTLLVFNYIDGIPEKYRNFAIMVDDYDRWIHNYPESKQLNRLFFIQGIKRFEERCLHCERPHSLYRIDKLLLELEEEKIEHYIDKLEKSIHIYGLSGDKKLGVVFADRYQSEVGHELIQRLDLDAIALIDANLKKISFRSKPNFDVGEIAKRLGGGGHKNASGAEFGYGNIDDFHGTKYPLYGVLESLRSVVFELYWKFTRTHDDVESEAIEKMFEGETK
nr:hypothetical protein 28 [Bacillaceae bacterium]